MELRIGYLRIIFLIEKRKEREKKCNEKITLQNNKRSVHVDRNVFDGINHIFLYPKR